MSRELDVLRAMSKNNQGPKRSFWCNFWINHYKEHILVRCERRALLGKFHDGFSPIIRLFGEKFYREVFDVVSEHFTKLGFYVTKSNFRFYIDWI